MSDQRRMYWPSASFGVLADCSDRTRRNALDRPTDFGLGRLGRLGRTSISAKHHTFMQSTSPTDDRHSIRSISPHACIGVGINNQSFLTLAILSGSIPAFARVLSAHHPQMGHDFPTTPRWDKCASIRRAYLDRRNVPI